MNDSILPLTITFSFTTLLCSITKVIGIRIVKLLYKTKSALLCRFLSQDIDKIFAIPTYEIEFSSSCLSTYLKKNASF